MPSPSSLAIATGSVRRLLKEEASYHKELAAQEAKIKTLEESIQSGQGNDDGNQEWTLKQEVRGLVRAAIFKPGFADMPRCSKLPPTRREPYSSRCGSVLRTPW